MAGTCDHSEPLHVYVDNRPIWGSLASVTDLVEIHYMGYVIIFQASAPNVLVGSFIYLFQIKMYKCIYLIGEMNGLFFRLII